MQASVHSVEDHGYLMDFGISGMNGFLSFDSIATRKEGALGIGCVVLAAIKDKAYGNRLCNLESSEETLKESLVGFQCTIASTANRCA